MPEKKTAIDKVQAELTAYRKETQKLTCTQVYFKAPEIMFAEAAADRLQHLCKDDDMAALVMSGGTLTGCVKAIVDYCKRDIGNSGEISEADFRAAIRDYYRLPDKAIASTHSTKRAEATTGAIDGKNDAIKSPKHKEPTMLSTQLDMFGMLTTKEGNE